LFSTNNHIYLPIIAASERGNSSSLCPASEQRWNDCKRVLRKFARDATETSTKMDQGNSSVLFNCSRTCCYCCLCCCLYCARRFWWKRQAQLHQLSLFSDFHCLWCCFLSKLLDFACGVSLFADLSIWATRIPHLSSSKTCCWLLLPLLCCVNDHAILWGNNFDTHSDREEVDNITPFHCFIPSCLNIWNIAIPSVRLLYGLYIQHSQQKLESLSIVSCPLLGPKKKEKSSTWLILELKWHRGFSFLLLVCTSTIDHYILSVTECLIVQFRDIYEVALSSMMALEVSMCDI